MFLIFTFSFNLEAQVTNFGCGGPPSIVNTSSILSPNCSKSSAAYSSRYNRVSNYIPQSNDPIVTIEVNFNIFQDDLGNGNFKQGVAADEARLNQYEIWLNGFYSSIQTYNQSPPNMPTVPQVISHSRIQFHVNAIYYYQNTTMEQSSDWTQLVNYVQSVDPNRLKQLNIMFTNGSLPQGGWGFTYYPSFNNIMNNQAIVTFKKYNNGNVVQDYSCASHLAHELGHCFNLRHSYNSSNVVADPICNQSDPNYYWDIFGYSPGSLCGFPNTSISNDLMGGNNGGNRYISPLQLGEMWRAISLSSMRKYVKGCQYNVAPPNDIIVNTDEVWDFDIKCYKNIRVQNNAKLTITCNVIMPDLSKIIVERGSKLIIDGGTITNDCGMWAGIEVWGNRNESQFPINTNTHQGYVELKNNAVIKNALTGITTIKFDPNTNNWDWNYTGGIIRATGSSFINNKKAIEFLSYHNSRIGNPSKKLNNTSYFRNCTFETNYNLLTPYVFPNTFVSLYDVEGVQFLGNTFRNTNAWTSYYDNWERGIGITSIDASYSIGDYCASSTNGVCTSVIKTNFDKLWYGVRVENVLTSKIVNVRDANFTDCARSIYMSKSANNQIVRNTISVPDLWQINSNFKTCGIYLDNCPTFLCTENTIASTNSGTSAKASWGILASNCGDLANTLYNNRFKNIKDAAIQAQDDNDGPLAFDGLGISCNDFENSFTRDINVVPSLFSLRPITNISNYQGSCTNSSTIARNSFITNVCGSGGIQLDKFNANSDPIFYNYSNSAGVDELQCYLGNVLPASCGISFDKARDCPSVFSNSITQNIARYYEIKNSLNDLEALYDGNQTLIYLNKIYKDSMSNADYNALASNSPYVSDRVLIALIDKLNGLNYADTKSIFIATSSLPYNVFLYLKNRNTDITNLLANEIEYLQNGNENASTNSREELNEKWLEISNLSTSLINQFNEDSCTTDFFNTAYETELRIGSEILKHDYLVGAERNEEAYVATNSIFLNAEVSNFIQRLDAFRLNVNGYFSILNDQDFFNFLQEKSRDENNGYISTVSRSVLSLIRDYQYDEKIVSEGFQNRIADATNPTKQNSKLSIYPNPSQSNINLKVVNKSSINVLNNLKIFDSFGRLVKSIDGFNIEQDLNIENLSNGVYFLICNYDGKLLNSTFNVIH